MNKKPLLIFIVFFIFSQAILADEGPQKANKNPDDPGAKSDWQGINSKWRVCVIDSDCIAGVESCLYWEAINKKYVKALSKSLAGCEASIDPGFQPVTVCVNKMCQVTDKTTEVSWEDWFNEMQKLKVKKN